jgi:transcriptional regulator with XRE-family HTH domain
MKYGRALRIVRTARGLTKSELAKRLEISASYLSLIEAEKRVPSIGVLEEISSVLGIPPHLLTLLASEPSDLDDPASGEEVSKLAGSLLRLLIASDDQPMLPLKGRTSGRKRTA